MWPCNHAGPHGQILFLLFMIQKFPLFGSPFISLPNSFFSFCSHVLQVNLSEIRCMYSRTLPVYGSTIKFMNNSKSYMVVLVAGTCCLFDFVITKSSAIISCIAIDRCMVEY